MLLRRYCCSIRTTSANRLVPLLWRRCLSSKHKKSLYTVLNVSPTATQAEIKQSFYKLSMRYHPDMNKDSAEAKEQFLEITEAYSILGQYEQRRRYDKGLLRDHTPPHGHQQASHPQSTGTKKKIYDFDEFYKAHYGEALRREQKRREAATAEYKKTQEASMQNLRNQLVIGSTLMLVFIWASYIFSKQTDKHNNM